MPGTRCPVWGTPCGVAMWPCQCILPKYAKMTISYGERDDCRILGCYSYTFLIYPTWNLLGYYPDPDARLTQPSSVSACFRLYLCWSKRHIFFNSNSYVSTCVFSKKKHMLFMLFIFSDKRETHIPLQLGSPRPALVFGTLVRYAVPWSWCCPWIRWGITGVITWCNLFTIIH